MTSIAEAAGGHRPPATPRSVSWLPTEGVNRYYEPFMAAAVLAGITYAMFSLAFYRELQQPFFYDPGDAWMDWFNTAFWAYDRGTYDTWGTLYPPVSFVFLWLVTDGSCYVGADPWATRECDLYGAFWMHAIFVINIVLTARVFMKIDPKTALFRSIAAAAGMPMLSGLERGNLVLITYTCFILAYGPLLRSATARWICVALAINFKVYLIASLMPLLFKRRWLWVEGALIATVLVYLVTWGLLGRGSPAEIVRNISEFAGGFVFSALVDLWYSTSTLPLTNMLEGAVFPVTSFLGSQVVEVGSVAVPAALIFVQGTILLAFAAAWLRPDVVPAYRLVNLGTCLALITSEAGGYTQAFIIFLTMFEKWRRGGIAWAIMVAYVLAIPGDIYLDPLPVSHRAGFLNSGLIFTEYWIALGPFVRPFLVLSIPFALSLTTIRAVWRDVCADGLAGRRRFRFDLPVLSARKA